MHSIGGMYLQLQYYSYLKLLKDTKVYNRTQEYKKQGLEREGIVFLTHYLYFNKNKLLKQTTKNHHNTRAAYHSVISHRQMLKSFQLPTYQLFRTEMETLNILVIRHKFGGTFEAFSKRHNDVTSAYTVSHSRVNCELQVNIFPS